MPPMLRDQIAALSVEEKWDLYHELRTELDGDAPPDEPLPDELKAELLRREEEDAADPSGALDLDDTMAELRAKYGR